MSDGRRLRRSARILLVPGFAAGMGLAYAASWIWLDRSFTAKTLAATSYIAAAAGIAAGAALLSVHLLARMPWSARLAAALMVLIGGTAALVSLFFAVEIAWAAHPLAHLPLRLVVLIVLIVAAGALYGFLALAGPLILPLGLPLVAATAVLMAGWPGRRRATHPAGAQPDGRSIA